MVDEKRPHGGSRPDSSARPDPIDEFEASSIDDSAVQKLEENGLIPSQSLIGWRTAPGEDFPMPSEEEIVVYQKFFTAGLGLPTSDFFRGLLHYYGLELVHLNPNSILHISVFVHLCEAFLGIPPHFALFIHLFQLKPQPSSNKLKVVGGAGLQLRNKNEYIIVPFKDSLKRWREGWFYCENHAPSLPAFTGRLPKQNPNWTRFETPGDSDQVKELLELIADHKSAGLTAVYVMGDWLRRRIQPLKLRARLGFEYVWEQDPTREVTTPASDDSVMEILGEMFCSVGQWPDGCAIHSYHLGNAPPTVSSWTFAQYLQIIHPA
jgi:hypothetical protein